MGSLCDIFRALEAATGFVIGVIVLFVLTDAAGGEIHRSISTSPRLTPPTAARVPIRVTQRVLGPRRSNLHETLADAIIAVAKRGVPLKGRRTLATEHAAA
jgi:hypothetical protein